MREEKPTWRSRLLARKCNSKRKSGGGRSTGGSKTVDRISNIGRIVAGIANVGRS